MKYFAASYERNLSKEKIEPKFQYSPEMRQFFLGCSKAELSLRIITSVVLVLQTMESLSEFVTFLFRE